MRLKLRLGGFHKAVRGRHAVTSQSCSIVPHCCSHDVSDYRLSSMDDKLSVSLIDRHQCRPYLQMRLEQRLLIRDP